MLNPGLPRIAAAVLTGAVLAGGALAQQPTAPRITDTAPPPAEDRASTGAVVLMDQPVIAQRRYLEQLARQQGPDTRSLGAGPAPRVLGATPPNPAAVTRSADQVIEEFRKAEEKQ